MQKIKNTIDISLSDEQRAELIEVFENWIAFEVEADSPWVGFEPETLEDYLLVDHVNTYIYR